MPDFSAIAAAIAARYLPGEVTPPAGLDNVRSSTAEPPGQLGALPAVVVFTHEGALDAGNGTRLGVHDFLTRFYFAQVAGTDLARDNAALTAWLGVLVDQHRDGIQLAGLVDVVRTVKWRIGIMAYAGIDYAGIELLTRATTSEPWAATA